MSDTIFGYYDLSMENYECEMAVEELTRMVDLYDRFYKTVDRLRNNDYGCESFYQMSFEDDDNNKKNKGNQEQQKAEQQGGKAAGFLKKAWIAIKTFFKKIFGYISNLIRKVRVAIAKAKHKKWTKRVRGQCLKWATSYKTCSEHLGDKMDYFLGITFSMKVTACAHIKHAGKLPIFQWGPAFEKLFTVLTEELKNINITVTNKHDDDTGSNNTNSDIDSYMKTMINTLQSITQLLKCKNLSTVVENVNKFIEAYKNADNARKSLDEKANGISKKVADTLMNFYKDVNNYMQYHNSKKTLITNVTEEAYYFIIASDESLVGKILDNTHFNYLAFEAPAADVLNFLRKTDGFKNKIYSVLAVAEKRGKENAIKLVNNFMLLYQRLTSLSFAYLDAQTKFRKFVLKNTKKIEKAKKQEEKEKKLDEKERKFDQKGHVGAVKKGTKLVGKGVKEVAKTPKHLVNAGKSVLKAPGKIFNRARGR